MTSIDYNYSTSRQVVKAEKKDIDLLFKQSTNYIDRIEFQLFLPVGEDRLGEGGLRKQGYFKVGGLISESGVCHSHEESQESSPLSAMVNENRHPKFLSASPNTTLSKKPLVTIVTVVFNGEQIIEKTILSVLNQTYDNIEYIIVDGGSTDGTLDIIKKYEHAIDYWVSEKDKGIYDAMNKGIDLATGEWINFMNGGDVFAENNVIKSIFKQEVFTNFSVIFGKSITYYKNLEVLRYKNFNSCNPKFYIKRMPNHQAVFIQKKLYKSLYYDLQYRYSADTDYLRRCFSNTNYFETQRVVSMFELGGISNFYNKFSDFVGNIRDSQRISGKKVMPFIKHLAKYVLQKTMGKDAYLKFYIKKVL